MKAAGLERGKRYIEPIATRSFHFIVNPRHDEVMDYAVRCDGPRTEDDAVKPAQLRGVLGAGCREAADEGGGDLGVGGEDLALGQVGEVVGVADAEVAVDEEV